MLHWAEDTTALPVKEDTSSTMKFPQRCPFTIDWYKDANTFFKQLLFTIHKGGLNFFCIFPIVFNTTSCKKKVKTMGNSCFLTVGADPSSFFPALYHSLVSSRSNPRFSPAVVDRLNYNYDPGIGLLSMKYRRFIVSSFFNAELSHDPPSSNMYR